MADAVLVIGVEVQNTVKAIYGADILAGAGHYSRERKNGHVYFFPNLFSDRAGAYYEKYGRRSRRPRHGRVVRAGRRERAAQPQGPGAPQRRPRSAGHAA